MENSALSQYVSEQELLLERQTVPSGLYPGDPSYDKFCEISWNSRRKTIAKLRCSQTDNGKSSISDKKSQGRGTKKKKKERIWLHFKSPTAGKEGT